MKSNENEKNIKQTGKPEKAQEREATRDIGATLEMDALAAFHNSLRFGERPAMPEEKSREAAGALGNQNVIRLMETGAEMRRILEDGGSAVDAQGLAEALSGQPDGPVCAMETIM